MTTQMNAIFAMTERSAHTFIGRLPPDQPSVFFGRRRILVAEFRITPFPPRESSASGDRLPPTGRTRAVI
jgi:hypothetical protein